MFNVPTTIFSLKKEISKAKKKTDLSFRINYALQKKNTKKRAIRFRLSHPKPKKEWEDALKLPTPKARLKKIRKIVREDKWLLLYNSHIKKFIPVDPYKNNFELLTCRCVNTLREWGDFFVCNFRVETHNLHCHMTNYMGKTVVPLRNGGHYGVSVSNFNLKHNIDFFVSEYGRESFQRLKKDNVVIPKNIVFQIFAPVHYLFRFTREIQKSFTNKLETTAERLFVKKMPSTDFYIKYLYPKIPSILTKKVRNFYGVVLYIASEVRKRIGLNLMVLPQTFVVINQERPFNGCRVSNARNNKQLIDRHYKVR